MADQELDYIKKIGIKTAGSMNVGSGVYSRIDEKVGEILNEAEYRAGKDGRKTIKARDI